MASPVRGNKLDSKEKKRKSDLSLEDTMKLVGVKVGVALCQLGEFGFVLSSHAHMEGLITSDMHRTLLGATAVSLLLTPFVTKFALKYLMRSLFKVELHNHRH